MKNSRKKEVSSDKNLEIQISIISARLNKLIEKQETYKVTDEIIDLSCKLDELIVKYQRNWIRNIIR